MVNPLLQSANLEVNLPWDYEQIEADAARLKVAEYSHNFNIENPKHKYFILINVLDAATTVYAMENRNSLTEANFLLPAKPTPEEIILHKALIIYALSKTTLFSNHPDEQWDINFVNVGLTLAVLNNLNNINKYD